MPGHSPKHLLHHRALQCRGAHVFRERDKLHVLCFQVIDEAQQILSAIIDLEQFGYWLDPAVNVPRLTMPVPETRTGLYERRTASTRVRSVKNDESGYLVLMSVRELL